MDRKSIGISGLAAYVPPYRVWLEDWCRWTNNQWPKVREVVGRSFRVRGPDQSIYTMAATAVIRLIKQYDIDPAGIKFLGLGTESSTDNSAGAIIVKGMVDRALEMQGKAPISRSCEVPEFKHACLGGVYGMKGALRHLALDGSGSQAIVVCADIAEYERGSTGEPTQGAGAVAMLLEEEPKLAAVDLINSCGQDRSESHQVQDFPVFNGKYSTTCYIDETLHALNDMYEKRGLNASEYLQSLKTIFMHRPYRKMPETGYAIAYLFALGSGGSDALAELASYCYQAGVEPDQLLKEMMSQPQVAGLADPERHNFEYRREILDKLALGSDTMLDLGNLYTAALPAWMAAGFEQAADEGRELAGEELLTLGYGSGDAAEVIPVFVTDGWREATAKIRFADSMQFAVDLNEKQYEDLHDGRRVSDLAYLPKDEFIIEKIGRSNQRQFQDLGIEYYRYVS
jgi:hydroxymethylglutaryl-CoA synthase